MSDAKSIDPVGEAETIVRIAAKGDGITASGRHAARAVPGDLVLASGEVVPGPHHVTAPCRHFGTCGGCQLQHCDDATLTAFVGDRVVNAAKGQGLEPRTIAAPHMSPAHSRRRASLRAINGGGGALIGFNQAGTHRVVDLKECPVLMPELLAGAERFKGYFKRLKGRFSIGLELVATDQGLDCRVAGFAPEGLEQTEDLLDLCRDEGFARLSLDHGYGPETFWEPEPVTVTLGGIRVAYPSGAFLQATPDGEAALVSATVEWLAGCGPVADLFAGLGTFALALAKSHRVTAVEADRAAHLACRGAVAQARVLVETSHRDLFRNPLRAEELAAFGGVVLDPPRAGARDQIQQIAASSVERVVYISCNPSSWSRDGAVLTEAGYVLEELRPVGQFRWSTHVELASLFVKRT